MCRSLSSFPYMPDACKYVLLNKMTICYHFVYGQQNAPQNQIPRGDADRQSSITRQLPGAVRCLRYGLGAGRREQGFTQDLGTASWREIIQAWIVLEISSAPLDPPAGCLPPPPPAAMQPGSHAQVLSSYLLPSFPGLCLGSPRSCSGCWEHPSAFSKVTSK